MLARKEDLLFLQRDKSVIRHSLQINSRLYSLKSNLFSMLSVELLSMRHAIYNKIQIKGNILLKEMIPSKLNGIKNDGYPI